MKVLIAIISCENNAYLGYPQAQRDTWLKGIEKYPDVDYKFFYGDGNPTGEDETFYGGYLAHLSAYPKYGYVKPPILFIPKEDEVVLVNTPDDYGHHAIKTRNKLRWAADKGYDYVLTGNDDMYVCIDRLVSSNFEQHDFIGRYASDTFLHGGPGIMLSRKSINILINSPVKTYGGDGFMSQSLGGKVKLTPDNRYTEWEDVPKLDNDKITSHLIVAGSRMYEVYSGLTNETSNRNQQLPSV